MREIIFRAKEYRVPFQGETEEERIKNAPWVYGDLVACDEGFAQHAILQEKMGDKGDYEYDIFGVEKYALVEEKTIGQFSGKYDRFGNRIFEGDIVFLRQENDYRQDRFFQFLALVVFSNGMFDYDFLPIGNDFLFEHLPPFSVTVVGNAFDTPNLLTTKYEHYVEREVWEKSGSFNKSII